MSRNEKILIGILGMMIVCALIAISGVVVTGQRQQSQARATQTAVESASQTEIAVKAKCHDDFRNDMVSLLSKFFREMDIAYVTARINLPAQISREEDIRNSLWNMSSKSCEPFLHAKLMDYVDKEIAAQKAFSGVNDYQSGMIEVEALKALSDLDDEVIRSGTKGGLVSLFREKGMFYWEKLDDPKWKTTNEN